MGHPRVLGVGQSKPRLKRAIDTCRVDMVLLGMRRAGIVNPEMGTFRVDVEIENPARPGERREVRSVLVDTGAELSWIPAALLESLGIVRYKTARFRQATGSIVERGIGGAMLHVAGQATLDDVVFGEPTDLVILGSRSLEGLNFQIDPASKRLIDAGPILAAAAA